MGEPPLRHGVVRPHRCLNVYLVDTNRHPHEHVLRPLHHYFVHLQKVRPLQGLKSEVVVVKIPVVYDLTVQTCSVLIDNTAKYQKSDYNNQWRTISASENKRCKFILLHTFMMISYTSSAISGDFKPDLSLTW